MTKVNVAVFGAGGRMGSAVAQEVLASSDLRLAAAIVRAGHELVGTFFPGSDVVVTTTLQTDVDVIIDFTLPEGVMEHLHYGKPMVIGTTGFTAEQLAAIEKAAQSVPILLSSNMSVGVNWCYQLLETTNAALDASWTAQVMDVHHQHKKDQPSGTAKEMARLLGTRPVTIHSERRGEVVGAHTVIFANDYEEIVIMHMAKDRSIFAKGAVLAARWLSNLVLANHAPRIYSMRDVVG